MAPALVEINHLPAPEGMWPSQGEMDYLLSKSFPKVPVFGSLVGTKEPFTSQNYPQPQFIGLLYKIVDTFDGLVETRPDLFEGVYSLEYSKEAVVAQQRKYMQAHERLKNEPGDDRPVYYASPIYGAVPIADQLRDLGIPADKNLVIDIRGSAGTVTGKAEVKQELPEALLDPNNTVVFTDDVGDSFITAAQLAMERRGKRLNWQSEDQYNDDEYGELIKSIQDLRKERQDFGEKERTATTQDEFYEIEAEIGLINRKLSEQYQSLTPLFREENVVIATLYSKNKAVYGTLKALAEVPEGEDTQWTSMQRRFLEVCTEVDENKWLEGGQGEWKYPLLDGSIDGGQLLKKIPQKYHALLESWGLGRLSLRIGAGIKGLAVFDGAKTDDLIDTIADWIVYCLDNSHDEEWHTALTNSRSGTLF